ncbi:MAG: thiamine phosphate synthase [Flexistipes sinusarabici]|uniref:Thiamine-phosphate synthase n=1 Tax=Flexistipes sinusarabici TaxID=2352 RepID=A0A5D0MMM2_FLESI|nr:thiamine phosphate synthase [Flexistipes sinusarabici]TYB32498.1 MAG: thiamine phosphate synthase [Flexistipes sinusarabici]
MCSKNRSEIADFLKLYLVFESSMLKLPLDEFMQQVIDGGITAFQLRDKNVSARKRVENGKKAAEFCRGNNIPFIANDRIDIARILAADGVHLGDKDIPLDIAKNEFGEFFYGYSCNNSDDVGYAAAYGAAYTGIGPIFDTSTKRDLREILDKEKIRELTSASYIPSVGIGGINKTNAESLKNTGLNGIAVVSAICASENPYRETRILRELVEDL